MRNTLFHSFRNAWQGLKTVWVEERNFKIDCFVGIIVLASFFYVDFSAIEMSILIFAVGLTLSAEIANTAIEDLCNKVEPRHDLTIGKIKDTMGAFVLIIALTSAVVGIIIYAQHF